MSQPQLPDPDPVASDLPPAERRRLEHALALLPLPAVLLDPATEGVLHANRAMVAVPAELWAATAHAPEGHHAADPDGFPLPADQMPVSRAARGDRLLNVPITWHTPDADRTFLVSSGPAATSDGAPLAVLTFVDVTPFKHTEQRLRQAVQVREEFFSVATHELRDPLSALQLSLDLLRHTVEKHGTIPMDALLRHLQVSRRQSERLARLIEELLDVARIANKRLRLDVEAFDLCELVTDAVQRFRAQAGDDGQAITVEPCEPIIGYWDRLKLEQVLTNLLSNARKYGGGRPVVVRLCATPTAAFFQVEDRGIGIAPADQARVFDRFERATGSHKTESLGLGLYIVRSLVEAHGGSISLRSDVGTGSTFTVELPRKRMPQEAPSATP